MTDALLLVLRILTACSSMFMILSPAPAIRRIHQTQNVGHTSIIALASLLGNCHMWMLHGYLRRNIFPVFITFAIGDVVALGFIAVYVRYSTERVYVLKVLGVAVLILGVVTIYTVLALNGITNQTREQVKPVVGYIAIAAAVLLYGSPFEKVVQVLRHKTSVFLPITMVVVGTINNSLWVIYTPLDHNWFMFVPNAICSALGFTQLALYWFYHPSRSHTDAVPVASIDEFAFALDTDGIPIAVVVDSPKTDAGTDKQFPASPNYNLLHSPLAVVEINNNS